MEEKVTCEAPTVIAPALPVLGVRTTFPTPAWTGSLKVSTMLVVADCPLAP